MLLHFATSELLRGRPRLAFLVFIIEVYPLNIENQVEYHLTRLFIGYTINIEK